MKIYLDIDGTLIHEDLTENYGKPAAGLETFIRALRDYEVYWLTTHCRDGKPERAQEMLKKHVSEELHPLIDSIKPTVWDVNKTEGIDWNSEFIWIDNDIFPEERAAFGGAPDTQSFIEVDLRANPKQLVEVTNEIIDMSEEIKCEHCGSTEVQKYVYGLPGPELIEESQQDENIILGGCVLDSNSPRYKCKKCDKDFGTLE